jgi:ABC-type branched-chain amino acid transport systems, periplasmic component
MTRRPLRVFGALALTGLLVAAAGCQSTPGENTTEEGPIRIGVAIALTGSLSENAQSMVRGYELWAEQVNAAGGINGRQVELIMYDDESNSDTARLMAERLVERDRVDLILGPYGSPNTAAMAAVVERAGVPMIGAMESDAAARLSAGSTWAFQAFAPSVNDMDSFMQVADRNGARKVALVVEDAGFTAPPTERVSQTLGPQLGMTIDVYKWSRNDLDFSSIVQRVDEGDYDAVYALGYLPGTIRFAQAMIELGVQVDGIHLNGPDPALLNAFSLDKLEGVMGRTPWHYTLQTKGNEEFVQAYLKKYPDAEPDLIHMGVAAAYAAGQLIQAAIEEVGLDKAKLKEFFATAKVDTVLGTYELDSKGNQLGYKQYLGQWQDGVYTIVVGPQPDQDGRNAVWPKPNW